MFLILALILGVLSTQAYLVSSTQTSPTQISPTQTSKAINTPWLSISGRYIKDPSGKNVILRGVSLVDVSVANSRTRNANALIDMATDNANGWYARVIRLPVYPDAIDGQPGWNANPDAYFTKHLDPAVQHCISKQIYCIIDWHYIKDYNSSDVDTATRAFWNYVAPKYASTPNVLFELYNEPIYPDSWSTWKTTAQPWVDIIRAAAPQKPDSDRRSALVPECCRSCHQPLYRQQPGLCGSYLPGAWWSERLGFLVWEQLQHCAILHHRMGLAAGRKRSHQRNQDQGTAFLLAPILI